MHLIAYFTAAERRLWRWAGGRLTDETRFTADERGLADWHDRLARSNGALLTIVADLAGDEFHEEKIPRLRGGDRAAVLRRRLAQRFDGARLAAALRLGPSPGGRNEERWLLASVSGARQFDPWLDALRPAHIRLAGFPSTALLAPEVIAKGGDQPANELFVSVHSTGLCEGILERGRLRFSRFEPSRPGGENECAHWLRAELDRLAGYLETLRASPARGAIPVTVIAKNALRRSIEHAVADDARFALRFEAQESIARRLGLREAPAGSGAEAVFLAQAARRLPREQFAGAGDRREFIHWRQQRALLSGGAFAAVACAIVAGAQWHRAGETGEEARALRIEATAIAQRHERIASARPELPTSAQNLRIAVGEMRRVVAKTVPPEAALAHLARALERCPGIELEALAWALQPLEAGDAAAKDRPTQTLEITARVGAAPRSDVRTIGAEIARFAAALQGDSGWRVERTRLPFDLTPQGTLSGEDAAAERASPSFFIAIARALE